MEEYLGAFIILLAFLSTVYFTKKWIKVAKKAGFIGKDMNKEPNVYVPEAGGIIIVFSVVIGLCLLIFTKTFIITTGTHLIEILTFIVTILLAGFIGFVDDVLGWKKGIKGFYKVLLTIPIAITLMVLNSGESIMLGIQLGLFYPLIVIFLGVIGATNGFNMLGGINGLEAMMSSAIMIGLGIITYNTGQFWLAFICGLIFVCLEGFLLFNGYKAKIFPGNTLTYLIGASIACIAILGNIEFYALIMFIPYFIEFILKARSKFKAESFGILTKERILKNKYEKIYSLTHLLMGHANEREICFFLYFIELGIVMFTCILVVI